MLAAAIAGVLVGLGLGLAIGGGDDEADPVSGLRDARGSLQRAVDVLEIVTVEYAEGVEGGRVTSDPEYQASRRAITRSRDLYAEARPVLAYIDPDDATRIDRAYARLARQAADRAPEQEVERGAQDLSAALDRVINAR
jgi:hypothetical protein